MSESEELMYFLMYSVFFCVGFFGLLHEIYIRVAWSKSEGKVISLINSGQSNLYRYSGVSPIVQYQTPKGWICSHCNFYVPEIFCSYMPNQRVTVYYNPRKVKVMRIKGSKVPMISFFVFFAISLFLYWVRLYVE